MALISNYTRKTNSLTDQTRSIKSSLQSTRRSLNNINKIFDRRTRIKSSIFRTRQLTNNRKLEALKRREQRDAIDAAKTSISRAPGPIARLRNTGKSFLGRILDFIASLALGWLVSNLPTWITYGAAFAKRIRDLWRILTGFVRGVSDFLLSFGNTLGGVIKDIATFDFASIPSTIERGMNDLERSIDDMTAQFEEGFSLFKKPIIDESEMEEPEPPTPQEQSGVSVPSGYGFGPSMTATGGAKASPYIYSPFGPRKRPTTGASTNHGGVDISGGPWQQGTPVSVIKPGVVVAAEDLGRRDWGKYVVVKHNDGTYSLYGHLSQINVRTGDRIENKTGSATVIGKVGSTGVSTGPHLHFELGNGWNGTIQNKINPAPYIDSYVRGGGDVKTAQISPTAQPQQTLMGQPSGKAGKRFSLSELVSLAKQAGFRGDNAAVAAAVAYAESTGNSMAHNRKRPDNSYGLWQINMLDEMGPERRKKFGLQSNEDLFDPLTNAKIAYKMSGGSNFGAWSTFNPKDGSTPKYLKFLPEARQSSGVASSQYQQGEFSAMQQQNVPGSITPTQEGEVVFAQFPSSGVSAPAGMGGGASSGQMAIPPSKPESEVLNNFIKNRLLVELSYL
jgi:murein DD-endopeptidase MepM/ murein hydrolase activator NlpD